MNRSLDINSEYIRDIIIEHSTFLCCDKKTETKMTYLPDVNDLDSINTRKIHRLTSTPEDTVRLLQHLKLLPTTVSDPCSKGCNNWYMGKSTQYDDSTFHLNE